MWNQVTLYFCTSGKHTSAVSLSTDIWALPTCDGTASLAENGDVLSNHCNALHTFGHHDGNCLQGIFVKLDLPPSPSFENDTLTHEFIIEHLFVWCKEYFRPLEKAAFFSRFILRYHHGIYLPGLPLLSQYIHFSLFPEPAA